MISFIRLIRPLNLTIIVATMMAMRYFIVAPVLKTQGLDLSLPLLDFWVLVLIMVLLAASGNIINDYFDVRVDRINKPNRVIIDHGVKRRVAMLAHQGINIVALGLTMYLCYQYRTWWPILIPIVIMTGLWFYSMTLKKTFLLGNITIALIVASVPLWSGVFELESYSQFKAEWHMLALVALFAFMITLVREIIKDIEDIEGDQSQGFKTIPIVWGIPKSKRFAAGWAALLLIVCVNVGMRQFAPTNGQPWEAAVVYCLLVVLPIFILIFMISRASDQLAFRRTSQGAKICMATGIAYSAVWALWVI